MVRLPVFKYWFVVVGCLLGVLSHAQEDACEAKFYYLFVNDNTVVLYNASSEYSDYDWEIDGQIISSPHLSPTLTYTMPSESVSICLRIWNDQGCFDEYCSWIHQDAAEELCNQSDCVWPGDTDGDWKANNYDLLYLGLGYGATGPDRPFFPMENNPTAWLPNFSWDWDHQMQAVNYKHLDCNGDGLVDASDMAAIYQNYTPAPAFPTSSTFGAPPIYLELEATEYYLTHNSPDFFQVNAELYLGSSGLPFQDIHGIAFYLTYPEGLTAYNAPVVLYENGSFFGNTSQVLSLNQSASSSNAGRMDVAFSRKSGVGISGNGLLAKLNFVVSSDIIEGIAEPEVPFNIGIEGIVLIDEAGNTLNYDLKYYPQATFYNVTLEDDPANDFLEVRVMPNPANDYLTIQVSHPFQLEAFELLSTLGQQVYFQAVEGQKEYQIDVSQLPPGIYQLNSWFADRRMTQTVVIR
ncbi:MAG TPA: T9SS type A sorting domain-containing protein [Saprospiraceae bacterium]|nr:T9SS type A sorting domain-containing protein [Saprospiraceae bacterium]HMQ84520.1 T9SS type A sorting domain-containing protein [Saprospiraceae bacterium]